MLERDGFGERPPGHMNPGHQIGAGWPRAGGVREEEQGRVERHGFLSPSQQRSRLLASLQEAA
jgi:hypothetical protein